jgi:uncharacterized protein (DUF1684 family)
MSGAPPDWQQWRAERDARLRGPSSPLALTGTHWFDAELVLAELPGRWQATGSTATLTAAAADGLTVDGTLVDGTVEVRSDLSADYSDVRCGNIRLVLIDREGVLAVRVYDPAAVARRRFAGVESFRYDPSWVRPARFTPFETVLDALVPHVDGVLRRLPLGGVVTFSHHGAEVRLQVEVDPDDGVLEAVFTDGTSAADYPDPAYRFRFVLFPRPAADGSTVADLNRAYQPPCAFSEFYVCPLPPPGNSLPFPIRAGERAVAGPSAAHPG